MGLSRNVTFSRFSWKNFLMNTVFTLISAPGITFKIHIHIQNYIQDFLDPALIRGPALIKFGSIDKFEKIEKSWLIESNLSNDQMFQTVRVTKLSVCKHRSHCTLNIQRHRIYLYSIYRYKALRRDLGAYYRPGAY